MLKIVYVLVHEYKNGFSAYVYETKEERSTARKMLEEEYAEDFERCNDFLTEDDVELGAFPWTSGAKA